MIIIIYINESQKETDKDLQEQELEDRNSLSAEEKEY